jgi:hypothetical protein
MVEEMKHVACPSIGVYICSVYLQYICVPIYIICMHVCMYVCT